MQGKFKKKKSSGAPGISTSSLPDIIFILLFFFMVSTVLREENPLVKVTLPKATELTKLEKKNWISHIYIGPPTRPEKFGTAPKIQLNDSYGSVDQIIEFVENERSQKDERIRPYMTFSLEVDKDTKMGLVTDVKQELRKANQLKINYATIQRIDQ